MSDYIPFGDLQFNLWQKNLMNIIREKLVQWEISSDKLSELETKESIWNIAFSKASNKQNRTAADVQAKKDARDDHETAIRGFVKEHLANNSKVTDSDRTRMGLTVKSGTRTLTPVPDTYPVGTVDFSVRLQHTINFNDESTPRSKAKPAGVHGCEIWVKVGGEAPKDASELTYLCTKTATPYVANYEGKIAGTTVHYWLRWVNTRGEQGPWSATISGMIVG